MINGRLDAAVGEPWKVVPRLWAVESTAGLGRAEQSIARQSRGAYWKSCVFDGWLVEEEVEELALRLPYPLMLTLEGVIDGGEAEEGEGAEDGDCEQSRASTQAVM